MMVESTLPHLPPDVLLHIAGLLSSQELIALVLIGNHQLHLRLACQEGNLSMIFHNATFWPAATLAVLHRLLHLRFTHKLYGHVLPYYFVQDVDMTVLPRSLVTLELDFPNALCTLYCLPKKHRLSKLVSSLAELKFGRQFQPENFAADVFVKSLPRRLTSLTLPCDIPVRVDVAKHLPRTIWQLAGAFTTKGILPETVKSKWPLNLTDLTLHNFDSGDVVRFLPSSLLHLRVTFSTQILDSRDMTFLHPIDFAPVETTFMTIGLLRQLPQQLETLELVTSRPFPADMTQYLPRTLTALRSKFQPGFFYFRPRLPPHLTSLTGSELSLVSITDASEAFPTLPATLTTMKNVGTDFVPPTTPWTHLWLLELHNRLCPMLPASLISLIGSHVTATLEGLAHIRALPNLTYLSLGVESLLPEELLCHIPPSLMTLNISARHWFIHRGHRKKLRRHLAKHALTDLTLDVSQVSFKVMFQCLPKVLHSFKLRYSWPDDHPDFSRLPRSLTSLTLQTKDTPAGRNLKPISDHDIFGLPSRLEHLDLAEVPVSVSAEGLLTLPKTLTFFGISGPNYYHLPDGKTPLDQAYEVYRDQLPRFLSCYTFSAQRKAECISRLKKHCPSVRFITGEPYTSPSNGHLDDATNPCSATLTTGTSSASTPSSSSDCDSQPSNPSHVDRGSSSKASKEATTQYISLMPNPREQQEKHSDQNDFCVTM